MPRRWRRCSAFSHELLVSAETGKLLEAAASELDGTPPDADDACLVRVTRRRWEKARRVPTELAADLARAASVGHHAWVEARSNSDYGAFAPYLEQNLELARRYVDCFDGFECAYDVVLDDFEPGMKTAEVASLFAELKAELVPLISTVMKSSVDDSCLHGSFPIDDQRQLVADVVALMGFDPGTLAARRRSASVRHELQLTRRADHDSVGSHVSSPRRSTVQCMSVVTACMRPVSLTRCNVRHWAMESR